MPGLRYGFRVISSGRMLSTRPARATSSPDSWRPSGTWLSADRPVSRCSPSERIAIIYGIVTVATILVYRNYFHRIDEVEPAIADLGVLVVITGAGFVLAAAVTPPMTARVGVRAWIIACLAASAVFQVVPGAIYAKVPLGIAAFLLG